jgi:hypothetical protein
VVGARCADRDRRHLREVGALEYPRRVIPGSDDHTFPVWFFEVSGEMIWEATARMIHELLGIGLAGATASQGSAQFVNRSHRDAADVGYCAAGTSPSWCTPPWKPLCQANIVRNCRGFPRLADHFGADDTHYHVAPVTTPSLDPTGPP